MRGLMSIRPMATASKVGRGTPRLPEKVAEERESAAPPSTHFRASRILPKNMPAFTPTVQSNPPLFRSKQATAPLPENVRARLVGSGKDGEKAYYSSSGSEHEPSSKCLAAMVHEFMEEAETGKCGRARCNCETGSCSGGAASPEDDDSKSSLGGELSEILQGLTLCLNAQERTLLADVVKAMNVVTGGASEDSKDDKEKCASSVCTRRSVMRQLRDSGYNAALCKSRWDHAGSFPGGDYEYIDVLFAKFDGTEERVIVDIDFQGQFEIARPTSQYKNVVQALPPVYVGASDRLQQIVNVMSDAVKRSLKKKGMFLPPWRKPEYMRAKWFSSYRRTTNEASQNMTIKESSVQNISFVAVRGTGWDKKFTNEMELEFERAGSRQVTREMKNGIESARAIKAPAKRVEEEEEPEGVLRGANRLKFLWNDVKKDLPREIPETDNTEWQPPALLPRVPIQRGAVTGLTSMLRKAGLTSNNQQTKLESLQQEKTTAMAL